MLWCSQFSSRLWIDTNYTVVNPIWAITACHFVHVKNLNQWAICSSFYQSLFFSILSQITQILLYLIWELHLKNHSNLRVCSSYQAAWLCVVNNGGKLPRVKFSFRKFWTGNIITVLSTSSMLVQLTFFIFFELKSALKEKIGTHSKEHPITCWKGLRCWLW